MKSIPTFAITTLMLCFASPALAEDAVSGHWLVTGRVAGKEFTLDCNFQQAGQGLSGICVDGPTGNTTVKGGRAHPLTKGHVSGDQIAWTYQSSFLFTKFDASYAGVHSGDHMSGQISALGKTGDFRASRTRN
jgi:hypothetical protein